MSLGLRRTLARLLGSPPMNAIPSRSVFPLRVVSFRFSSRNSPEIARLPCKPPSSFWKIKTSRVWRNATYVALRHTLEVLIFQNEEGGLQGSRAISGELREENLNETTRSGKTLRDGIAFIGGDPSSLASVRRKPSDIFAYLELHIAQGGTQA